MHRRDPRTLKALLVCATMILLTAPALPPSLAQDPPAAKSDLERTIADLQKKIDELSRQIAEAKAAGSGIPSDRVAELERRLDVLAAELEKLRAGSAADDGPLASIHGLGPAASKVYARERGVSIGGYGEVLYQNFEPRADDGSDAGIEDSLDLVRAVFYFGYKFENGIVFNSEIEYEHATTGEGAEEKGEVSVEFAYLDFPLGKSWGARGGLLLIPVGLINELHEPTVFLGARRPDVERFIIPTTWREVGAGLYGDAGPLTWRAYVTAGLNAEGLSAEGIRDGRQGGSNSLARDLAVSGRLDWTILPGLVAGASVFTGDAGQGLEGTDGGTIGARTTVADVHADFRAWGLRVRGLYARGWVDEAAELNAALGLTGSDSIGEENHGWYGEAGYDVLRAEGSSGPSLVPYVRYERYDTQDVVPSGYERDPAVAVEVTTAGIAYQPIPNIVIKTDYQDYDNGADTGVDRFNLALGWIF